jgi:hypothetical protein
MATVKSIIDVANFLECINILLNVLQGSHLLLETLIRQ